MTQAPFGVFSVAVAFVVLRSAVAMTFAVTSLRADVPRWRVCTQGVSDVVCAVFLVAYVTDELRARIGPFVYVMFAYVAIWEGALAVRRIRALQSSGAASLDEWAVSTMSAGSLLIWEGLAVAPAVIAGFFIVFDRMAPGNWLFPGHVPQFVF